MSKQSITTLKSWFETGDRPTEAQFIDLIDSCFNGKGWGNYVDGGSSPATQTFTTTASKLQIDGLGATTNITQLPYGVTSLWDTTSDKIAPVKSGDSYDIRIDFTISERVSNPQYLIMILDIGGESGITNNIMERRIDINRSAPFAISFAFPIFTLDTFLANGGQIFFATDAGTATISSRLIFIKRDYAAL